MSQPKPAVYLRCSTRAQSVESQKPEILRYLTGQGWRVPPRHWYVDEAISGAQMDRPGLVAMDEAVFRGDVDTIVFYSVDRFARSLVDGINMLEKWQQAGTRLIFVSQSLDVNPKNPTGKLILQIMTAMLLAFAESERDRIGSRRRAGVEVAQQRTKRAQELAAEGHKPAKIAQMLSWNGKATAMPMAKKIELVERMLRPNARVYWGGKEPGKLWRPDVDTDAIVKLAGEGWTKEQIAQMLHCSRGTVYARLKEV
jgi:DNA invertase Pin-like site-specific DNA recombinase